MSEGAPMADGRLHSGLPASGGFIRCGRSARTLLSVGLGVLLLSLPAHARKKTRVRAEDDPRLGGDAKAFAKASVALEVPADLATVPLDGVGVRVKLSVKGYAIGPPSQGPRPHLLLLVDNSAALEVDDLQAPLALQGLTAGPHTLRAVLSRPWGEVVKAPEAFALTRFWLGARPDDEEKARKAESKAWPDPGKPLLTLVFPTAEERVGGPRLVIAPLPAPESEVEARGDGGAVANAGQPDAATAAITAPAAAAKPSPDSLPIATAGQPLRLDLAKLDKLRTIGAIYPNYIQIVASAESGIKTLADLKGKSLSVGAPKSGTELNSRAILAAAGLSYKDLGKVEYLPFAESVDLMKNRQLNATLQSAGLGVASLKDLSTSSEITVVSVPKEVVDKIGPPFVSVDIPANTYTGQDKDVPTAAVVNYLVTSSAVSDDLAYQMTKLIFESLPELANSHVAGKEIKLETAAMGSPVPLHPGAIRYYKEKGLIK